MKNVGPIRHCEPSHAHSPGVATVALTIGFHRVEMHQHAKFRHNRSIGCKYIKIFPFFKMAAFRHLGFVWGIFGGLYHSAKCGYDRCSSFYKPPAHRCPRRRRRQRQRVTEGTAMAPWNGPNQSMCVEVIVRYISVVFLRHSVVSPLSSSN